MRSGLPFTDPIAEPAHTVTAGITPIPTQRVSVTRSIGGAGLPSELGGGGDPVPAQADVEVVPDAERGMVVYQGSPWRRQGGRPLPLGTPLVIDTGEGDRLYRQFTGTVTADDGDHTAAMSLHAEDDLSWMTRLVSWPALFEVMPPDQYAPAAYRSAYRRIGLSHWYVLDRALRAASRGTHPKWGGGVGISAPLVDSSWPEFGNLLASYSHANGADFQPAFARSIGLRTRCATDLWATYQPSGPLSLSTTGRISVGLRVAPEHNGTTVINTRWATGPGFAVVVYPNRVVRAYSTADTNVRAEYTLPAGVSTVRVRLTTAGVVTIATEANASAASATITVPPEWTSTSVDRVDVQVGAGSLVGGLQVSSATLDTYRTWTQPTHFHASPTIPAGLEWMPRVHLEDISTLLADGCKAACLAWGVNADGVLQVKAPDVTRDPGGNTTTLTGDLIGALAWSRDVDTVRHQVVIRHQDGQVDQNLYPTAILWTGGGKQLERGERSVDIATTPADEEWLAHTEIHKIGAPIGGWSNPDVGRGTLVGGWLSNSDWARDELNVTLDVAEAAGLYVFTSTTVPANMPVGMTVALATAPVDNAVTTLPTRYRDANLPILRGWIKLTKMDTETRSIQTGPESAPDLIHDAGWWVQKGAQHLADWLAEKACPQPGEVGIVTLQGIPVRPDHRLEAGDVLAIHDESVTRLRLDILVRAITTTSGPGTSTMTLDVEVLDGHSTILTIGEVDTHYAGANIGAVEADKAGVPFGTDVLNPTMQSR